MPHLQLPNLDTIPCQTTPNPCLTTYTLARTPPANPSQNPSLNPGSPTPLQARGAQAPCRPRAQAAAPAPAAPGSPPAPALPMRVEFQKDEGLRGWARVGPAKDERLLGDKHAQTLQYSTVQYSTVQYSTVQYSTVQYSAVQCSTVQ
jgi:hypothetical protein